MLRDQTGINPSLSRDEWNIGVVAQPIQDVLARGILTPVHWLERDPWRILADPFCYQRADGRYIVLAEKLNHWTGRGEIWSALLPLNGQLSDRDFKLYARGPGHLSYPSRVVDQGTTFVTMETSESGGLHLWREVDGQPVYVRCLIDRPVVDPTFYRTKERWWLFCTMLDDEPNQNLYLYYSDRLDGVWTPHKANPVKSSLASARPAGGLFQGANGMLIRPAQNRLYTYGGGLSFNQIILLDPEMYSEMVVAELDPIHEYYCDGLHTISAAGQFTIIDGKRWHTTVLPNLARKVIAKTHKVQRLARRAKMGEDVHFGAEDVLCSKLAAATSTSQDTKSNVSVKNAEKSSG